MCEKNTENCDFAVIGLGRIGLPIAINAAIKGFKVLGVETNVKTVSLLCDKIVPFRESGMKDKLELNIGTNLFPRISDKLSKDNFSAVKCIMVAVGVHNINQRYPEPFEYDSIERVIDYLIEKDCLKGRLIVLRPTQPIGSTRKVRQIVKQNTGLIEGKDYFLAYMPERILEGSALEEEAKLPKIIGTFSEKSFDVANKLLNKLGGKVKRVSSPEVAEFVKLLDNSWRHTRFAFANDSALAAENAGIDVMEAITAANFDYPRNSIAFPGPVSGYCLGKDPYIFEYSFRKTQLNRKFNSLWYYSILSSKYLLNHVISKVVGNRILLMGLSFKKNIDDYRLSHGVVLAKKLVEKGYSVCIVDKDYNTNDYTQLESSIRDEVQIKKTVEEVDVKQKYDTVILSVDNDEFYDIPFFLEKHGKILDLWGIYKNEKHRFNDYWALGLGNQ
jgi:nucleotide sugar dehydrogenase